MNALNLVAPKPAEPRNAAREVRGKAFGGDPLATGLVPARD